MNTMLGLLVVITALGTMNTALAGSVITNTPPYDPNMIVQNPYIGWDYTFPAYLYFSQEKPVTNPPVEFNMMNIIVGWDQLEPTNNVYNWALLDNVLDDLDARSAADGVRRKYNIRLTCMLGGWLTAIKGVPDWLWNVVPSLYVNGTRHPYYFDATYQSELSDFYNHFAAHYAGRIYMTDFRCYGLYGEWEANPDESFPWADFPSVDKAATLRQLIDIGYNAFKDTGIALDICFRASLLTNTYAGFLDESALGYAMTKGFQIRNDSYNNGFPTATNYFHDVLDDYGATKLVYGETAYGWDTNRLSATLDSMLLTDINIGPKVFSNQAAMLLNDHFEWYERMMLNSGYRWVPEKVRYPAPVVQKQAITISIDWDNKGVGKLPLDNAYLAARLTLGGVEYWSQTDASNTFDVVNAADDSLMWRLVDAGGGYYFIENARFSNERLKSLDGATGFDLAGADTMDDSAMWKLVPVYGWYYIENKQFANQRLKSVDGGSTLDLTPDTGYPVMWKLVASPISGYSYIENRQYANERLKASDSGFNFKHKGPGKRTVNHTFTLNNQIPQGTLNLWVAIVDDSGTPFIDMPITSAYTNGWSLVGSVTSVLDSAYYFIENKKYINEGLKTIDGANSFDLAAGTGPYVAWKFVDAGSGYYYIQNEYYAGERLKALSTASFDLAAGTDTSTQAQWKLTNLGNGYYYLENRAYTGVRLKSVDGSSGFALTADTGDAVRWKLEKLY